MAKKTKTLSEQVKELTSRLNQLEKSISSKPKSNLKLKKDEPGNHFCKMPDVPVREFGPEVSPFREMLIRYVDKKWVNGTKLRYFFFKEGAFAGQPDNVQMVRDGFKVWEDVGIGISFEEVNDLSEAEIRISFYRDGSAWSYVGRDVIDIPGQAEPTMNFGWDLTQDPRGLDTPVHEIGHTLGFPHEHQNPNGGIVWDEDAVYDFFAGPPNFWSEQSTFHNVLRKLPQQAVDGSDWDPDSVMHYGFPAGLIQFPSEFANGLTPDLGLSETDIAEVKKFYPPIKQSEYTKLTPFNFHFLDIGPGEQKNFSVEVVGTKNYTFQTFGSSDTVMVLFEEVDGELRFKAGDDDSGTSLNAKINVKLYPGRRYVLRIRLFINYASGSTGIMMW